MLRCAYILQMCIKTVEMHKIQWKLIKKNSLMEKEKQKNCHFAQQMMWLDNWTIQWIDLRYVYTL